MEYSLFADKHLLRNEDTGRPSEALRFGPSLESSLRFDSPIQRRNRITGYFYTERNVYPLQRFTLPSQPIFLAPRCVCWLHRVKVWMLSEVSYLYFIFRISRKFWSLNSRFETFISNKFVASDSIRFANFTLLRFDIRSELKNANLQAPTVWPAIVKVIQRPFIYVHIY